jgi:transcriptional regulator NrdR family protein
MGHRATESSAGFLCVCGGIMRVLDSRASVTGNDRDRRVRRRRRCEGCGLRVTTYEVVGLDVSFVKRLKDLLVNVEESRSVIAELVERIGE